jgi:hypothetical protein
MPSVMSLLSFVLIIFLLTGCTSPGGGVPPTEAPGELTLAPTPTVLQAIPTLAAAGATVTVPAVTVAPTPGVTATAELPLPPPGEGLPPERWKEWPVVPQATDRARQIYQQGQAGDARADPHAFSKIGDCQAIKEALMGIFDQPGRYDLPSENDQDVILGDAIQHFKGSFNRDGMAVKGGFNAASLLSPMWADPTVCRAGENPLECELRVHRPAFVIISLEVWWEGRTTERYIEYMRKILDYAIVHGAVPILSTKADNVEGDNSINLANAQLAYEYDLPLWNFWAAAQPLPNHGLDPVRNDGFHISEDVAWPVRSLTALQALNSVWRGASGTNTIDPGLFSLRSSATPAASAMPAPTSAAPSGNVPAPIRGVKGVVFGLVDATTQLNGVYAFDPAGGGATRLEKAGFSLQAVSPDGQKLLLNHGPEVYLLRLDGSPPQLISNTFSGSVWHGAAWLPNGSRMALLDRRDGQDGIWLVNEDGTGWQRLSPAELQAGAVYPGPDAGHVYWGEVTCAQNTSTGQNTCGYGRVFSSALDGSPPQELAGVRNPIFAPGGAYFAYTTDNPKDKSSIFVAQLDRKVDRRIELGGTGSDFRVMDYAWSPNGKQLAVQVVARDTYTGHLEDTRTVLITPANWGTRELPFSSGQATQVTWSPGGGRVLLTSTIQEGSVYHIAVRMFDLATGKTSELDNPRNAEGDPRSGEGGKINLSGAGFLYLANVFWIN